MLGEYFLILNYFQDYKKECGKNWDSKDEERKRYELWLSRYKEME